ncbi:MAG: hypothetical protein HYR49_11930 [Gammaproteobacteria bacterium]|nr:hypothetical protein [Gammaproteobacteria bacterium]
MSAAWIIVRAFLELALGRRGPQDIPASHPLLIGTFAVYLAVTAVLAAVSESWATAIRAAAVDASVLPAFVLAVLWLRRRTARWLQTLTALTGIGVLFTAAAIPPFIVITHMENSLIAAPASLGTLVLFAWNLLAGGHILRHALSVSFPAGVLVAMAYVAASIAAVEYLVPEAAT